MTLAMRSREFANSSVRPFSCAARCSTRLRQAFTASSSRKNDSERIFPGSYRLSNRSTEMNPSIVSSSGRRLAAMSRYSCLPSGFGQTSKMTAIRASPSGCVRMVAALSVRSKPLRRSDLHRQPGLACERDERLVVGAIALPHRIVGIALEVRRAFLVHGAAGALVQHIDVHVGIGAADRLRIQSEHRHAALGKTVVRKRAVGGGVRGLHEDLLVWKASRARIEPH